MRNVIKEFNGKKKGDESQSQSTDIIETISERQFRACFRVSTFPSREKKKERKAKGRGIEWFSIKSGLDATD